MPQRRLLSEPRNHLTPPHLGGFEFLDQVVDFSKHRHGVRLPFRLMLVF